LALRTEPAVEISNFKTFNMADGRHLEKSNNVVLINIINSLLKTGNITANINVKNAVYTHCMLTATDRKPQKS